MDPVALAILVVFAVLWVAYGVGLLREWLAIRRARRFWVSHPTWYVDSPVRSNRELN